MSEREIKINLLSSYLECMPDDIDLGYQWYGEYQVFECGSQEYLVLTDKEANHAVKLYCEETAWAFNAEFILSHSKLPNEEHVTEMIQGYQEDKCESANETIKALIEDFDYFVEDAISCDGRGHFLSGYDGEEVEMEYLRNGETREHFYIYRIN